MTTEDSTIPEDIMTAAADVYAGLNANCYSADCDDSEKASDVAAIAQAMTAERQRCADIAASFSPGGERFEYHHDISTADAVLKAILGEA